jgi:hypothetical protein
MTTRDENGPELARTVNAPHEKTKRFSAYFPMEARVSGRLHAYRLCVSGLAVNTRRILRAQP